MGGYGSGRPAYKSQGTVEQFTRLHIRDLGKLPLGAWAVESGGQKVGLAWLTGTKGGAYPLLVCPRCEQNRRALYRVGGWWQCRVCGRLAYAIQHESDTDQGFRRAWKARNRLTDKGGLGDWIAPWHKPKGMHRTTFDRLLAKANSTNAALWAGLAGKVGL